MIHARFTFDLIFYPVDGGEILLRNASSTLSGPHGEKTERFVSTAESLRSVNWGGGGAVEFSERRQRNWGQETN
jgi:hypothetical protein